MKITIKIFTIFVFLTHTTLSNFYCENDVTILQNIKKIESKYIGEGSFGKIYGNNEEVSKTMKTEDLVSLQLLNNELKVMAAYRNEVDMMQLHSNNCWFQKKSGFNNYEVKIKMDRMEGDLKKAIASSSLKSSLFWKLDMLFKLATGIKKMHDINLLHLDLKEQNVMMMNKYTPVIADFGMAKLPGETRNFVGGTPLFMAPEIDRGVYSTKADIYALGIIFFQLLNERFLTQKYFRKLCDYNEFYYNNTYCIYDKLVNSMVNGNPDMRPSIDEVIQKIFEGYKKILPLNQDGFNSYLRGEKQVYESSSASFATKKNSDLLIQKYNQRLAIYSQIISQMVQNYCTPQKDAKKFLTKYSDKYAFVGPSPQEIQKLDQTFYQEDLQKSKINLQNRMNYAEQSRIQIIDNQNIFKQNEIQDNQINLPKIQIHKRAVSNNIGGQFQHMQQQKNYGFNQGQQHQQVVNRLNLSPQKKIYQVQKPANVNYHYNNAQVLYQNKPAGNQLNLPQINQFNHQQVQNFQGNQFLKPNQHLVVNQPIVQQQPITRPGLNEYQRYQQRQNVDSVGGLLGKDNFNYQNQKAVGKLYGRFII